MERTVNAGMRNTTVTLDGTECAVTFSANYRCFEVMNDGDGDITASIYKGKNTGEDGVITVHAGMSATVAHMRTDIDTVYVNGSGTVQVAAKNSYVSVFNGAARGGDSGANLKAGYKLNYGKIDRNWKIRSDGKAEASTTEDIIFYSVIPGSAIYVKAKDDSNECKFVWTRTDDISTSNTYDLIGGPFTDAAEGILTVPEGAKIIAFSISKTDTETGVYAVRI